MQMDKNPSSMLITVTTVTTKHLVKKGILFINLIA